MALLSFVESAPRAYRLKASNAASPISTSSGTIPATNSKNFVKFLLSVSSAIGLALASRLSLGIAVTEPDRLSFGLARDALRIAEIPSRLG
jgi:hypothetical protein